MHLRFFLMQQGIRLPQQQADDEREESKPKDGSDNQEPEKER